MKKFNGKIKIHSRNPEGFKPQVDLVFQHGKMKDLLKAKDEDWLIPRNTFCWIEDEELFLWKNHEGEFYRINFEKYEL